MTEFDRAHFDELYRRDADPWRFRSSAYERDKYAATLAALRRGHYRSALELGCSIGELTRRLVVRTDRLTAVDTAAGALAQAKAACPDPRVEFVQAHLPEGDWSRPCELIVLSEILYYLSARQLCQLAVRLRACCHAGTELLLVHWTGPSDYPLHGDAAVELLKRAMAPSGDGWTRRHACYRMDSWLYEPVSTDALDAAV